jgi:hypothetical protein
MNYTCEGCDQQGDAADFPDLICHECGGTVVTLEQAAKTRKQYEDFKGTKNDDWQKRLGDESCF